MTKITQTVWNDSHDNNLLVQKEPELFYIPLGNVSLATLRELNAAIEDALTSNPPPPPHQIIPK